MQLARYFIEFLCVAFSFSASAAEALVSVSTQTKARLILASEMGLPGETVMAGIDLRMPPGWHTYWRNPGDSGMATKIEWTLPAGVTAGDIQWPIPEKFSAGGLTTYVHHDQAVLLVPLTLAIDLPPGPLELKAHVSWLECKEVCLPGKTDVRATLAIGTGAKPSSDAALIAAWQKKLPQTSAEARARWEPGPTEGTRILTLEWPGQGKGSEDFFPYSSQDFEVQPATERLETQKAGVLRVRKQVKKFEGEWPTQIAGLLVNKPAADQPLKAWEVKLSVAGSGPSQATVSTSALKPSNSLWAMLGLAFLGGLILNIMPCVLPVIALKILSFVNQSQQSPQQVRQLGVVYAFGVLFSFLVLAGLVIGVKAAGHKAGWGMQFSNPQFIVAITVLVTLVALNLFGVFEVTLSGRVMGTAGELASKHGAAGAFFNGVLATVLATPCTAPFLSTALGFAFVQPAMIVILVFLTVGLGLAAPFVVLSWQPAWLKFLPKPGAWMEKFKIAMGFPMLATGVWLFSLTTTFYSERSWWLAIFLVFIGAAAWVFGAFIQRGGQRRGLAAAVTLLLLATGYVWALEGKLRWRSPVAEAGAGGSVAHAPEGYAWQRWSAEAVTKARAEGRVVIVDFTAKWCLTCNITVKPALQGKAVIEKLKQLNAVALVADYTTYPDDITDELARFDRSGVPLVLVYPATATKPPIVLPDPLPPPAPYGPVVLEALKKAAD